MATKKTTSLTKSSPAKKATQALPQTELQVLINMGKKKGFLTFDEVNRYLPPHILSSKDIDNALSTLSDLEIEIVDSEKDFKQSDRRKENGDGGDTDTA